MRLRGRATALLLLLVLLPACADDSKTAFLIPIEDEIDDEKVLAVKERIDEALRRGAETVFFEIDSPGGFVSSCEDLAASIEALKIRCVVLIPREAYSGATMVALAGDEIVMWPRAVLGACRPIMIGPDGPEPSDDGVQEHVRTVLRIRARRNGYPVAVVEELVTKNRTLTAAEARDLGVCAPLVESREEALRRFGLTPGEVQVLEIEGRPEER